MKRKTTLSALIAAIILAPAMMYGVSQAADSIAAPGQTADDSHGVTAPATNNGQSEDPAVTRGRYVAIAGDCAACHTDPNQGKPFAGGYALQTPFGKLLASNITFDKETGIGSWTEEQFIRAVREGKGKEGEHLYPAMPYNDYVKVSDQDMHDLWAYMQTVTPVNNKVVSNQLPFPFNIRLMMLGWNLLFFNTDKFEPLADKSDEINRGAYLVEGLGHCGACHTPKNFLGGDKSAFLQGGNLDGWHAPEITSNAYTGVGGWSEQQIVDYLKTGSNDVAVASGPMAEAVTNSTQHMTDQDLHAIAVYLKSLPASDNKRPTPIAADDAQMKQGANVYSVNCSACHNSDGKGIPQLAASLANNPAIQAPEVDSLLTTVLEGGRGAVTHSNPTSGAMPSFAWKLSDAQTASVLTYIRNSWGNAAPAVTEKEAAKARKALKLPQQMAESSPEK